MFIRLVWLLFVVGVSLWILVDVPGLLLGLIFVVWLGLLQILLDVCGLELCLVCVLLDLLCGFASCPFMVLLVSVIYVVQLGVWWFGVVVGGCLFAYLV